MLKIVDILKFIVNLIIMLIDMVFNVFTVAISCIKALFVILGALPPVLLTFIIAIISVSIIYKLISMGGSGE